MESKSTPYIYIMDKISGKPIMHVRLAILKSGRMTNTFELDYLLDLVRDSKKKAAQMKPAEEPALGTPEKSAATVPANKPLAKPTKVPTKDKVQPTATEPGDQMGEIPAEENPEKV